MKILPIDAAAFGVGRDVRRDHHRDHVGHRGYALELGKNVRIHKELAGQNAPVVRAFHRAVGALEYLQERERSRKTPPANAGKSWSPAGDQQVCEELRRGVDFYQIAKTHNRSIGSIVARLVKLGKIGPNTPLDMFDPKVA